MESLKSDSFNLLLKHLHQDREQAAELYELLRLKLIKFFLIQGASEAYADILADEALNRVADKIGQNSNIANVNAFALSVARYILLEHRRKNKEENFGENPHELVDETNFYNEVDERLACLRHCLKTAVTTDEDRELIISYYTHSEVDKLKEQRKALAEKYGLTLNALKVRAYRLRARLEKCINQCVKKGRVRGKESKF